MFLGYASHLSDDSVVVHTHTHAWNECSMTEAKVTHTRTPSRQHHHHVEEIEACASGHVGCVCVRALQTKLEHRLPGAIAACAVQNSRSEILADALHIYNGRGAKGYAVMHYAVNPMFGRKVGDFSKRFRRKTSTILSSKIVGIWRFGCDLG